MEFQNELLQSASYLVDGILVDCGNCPKISEYLQQNKTIAKAILLTHCHLDHIYGLCNFLKQYPKTKVYCSQLTAQGLKDERMNLSYIIPDTPFQFEFDDNVVVIDQGKQTIEGIEIEVIATPGHSDDCFTYIIGNNIFTGDSYIPFAKVFTKWPKSNKQLALENEAKLKDLIEQRDLNVYPGHWQ